jgi:hypothetical protein
MDSIKINIRILYWHFKIGKHWSIEMSFNKYHWNNKLSDGLCKVYKWEL